MAGIREVLAANLKECRRKHGFSQDRLAELADISSQYLATVETCRKFPTPEVLERLAAALGIEPHQLFAVSPAPEEALVQLRQDIVDEVKNTFGETVEQAMARVLRKCKVAGYKGK